MPIVCNSPVNICEPEPLAPKAIMPNTSQVSSQVSGFYIWKKIIHIHKYCLSQIIGMPRELTFCGIPLYIPTKGLDL